MNGFHDLRTLGQEHPNLFVRRQGCGDGILFSSVQPLHAGGKDAERTEQSDGITKLPSRGNCFDPPNAPESHGQLLAPAVDYFQLTYPVGYSRKADVDTYLGRQPREVLNIPKRVVLDRGGMIRAMSGAAGGDPRLEDESSLRSLIEGLHKEGAATPGRKQ